MDETLPIKPFRWNLAKREQLGDLSDVEISRSYRGFHSDLRTAAAKVLARGGDSDLAFIGRSPEVIFDYLSGIFEGVPDAPSLTLLQFSCPSVPLKELAASYRAEMASLLAYFAAERLDPQSIASYGKQVRFIDVVASGQTFGALVDYLRYWSREQGADWNVVERRIGFIGITQRAGTGPLTWRWWQRQPWTADLTKTPIKNVSVPYPFWGFIANNDEKVTPSHRLSRWASEDAMGPRRDPHHLKGLRLALDLYDRGRDKAERIAFARELSQAPEMREAWLRSLVLRLRKRVPG